MAPAAVAPEKVVPLTTTEPISAPVVPATNQGMSRPVYNRADGERLSVHPREAGFRAAAAVA